MKSLLRSMIPHLLGDSVRCAILVLAFANLATQVTTAAAEPSAAYDAKEYYTKYEYRIPMRDGVKLFTSVLIPKDTSTTYPFLIVRTPYGVGPYGVDEYSTPGVHMVAFLKAGYIWVQQDVRGRTYRRANLPK